MNITRDGRISLADARYVADESDRRVREGDVLFNNTNSAALVGKTAFVGLQADGLAYSNHMTRLRFDSTLVESRFVAHQLQSMFYKRLFEHMSSNHVNQASVASRRLLTVEVAIPEVGEQRRIVEILEDHLSRLDAATAYRAAADLRARALVKSVLLQAIPDETAYPPDWYRSTVSEAGRVELGRQRHPDWHTGPNMKPYLRVANVFEDRVDLSDVKEMHWPGGTFERFRLEPGDVLLNEGQSPELLGRPAIYRGDPAEVAFTNSLIRFKASGAVIPEFALLVFRRHMHAGRFARESRITTNIAHLSAARLKPIEFPLPHLDEQRRIVDSVALKLDAAGSLRSEVASMKVRELALRRALLSAAFSGRLTGRSTDVEVVEELADV
ncbi:MAG: restriction endonuclease subunit S [Dermatophilaceae bacterium]